LSVSRLPRPVFTGRYRYSRWRWRVLVYVLDSLGALLLWLWRLVRAKPVVNSPRRIVIIQLDHLGDGVLTTAMLPGLRMAYPDASIDVLASPSNQAVFATHPEIDRVLLAEKNWFERQARCGSLLASVWTFGRLLRTQKYDLGIDVRGDILSVLVLALAGIPRRVGWAMGGGGFLLTDIAEWKPGRHEVESRLSLLAALNIHPNQLPGVTIGVRDEDRIRIAERLLGRTAGTPRELGKHPARPRGRRTTAVPGHHLNNHYNRRRNGRKTDGRPSASVRPSLPFDDPDWLHAGRIGQEEPLLAIHLGAGTQAKRWPLKHWRSLIALFLQEGWRVVIIGGPEETNLKLDIIPNERVMDWTGTLEITETTALLERADLFIGGDSGPAHLAACAGVPSVILFSGTNHARQWRPWSRKALVLKNRISCRPCHRKICPLADHPCLTGISPERVFQTAKRWWNRTDRPRAALPEPTQALA